MGKRVELELYGISRSKIHGTAYALVLKELGGERHLPIVVGEMEAQAIAVRLQGVVLPRPLTHDLMTSMLHAYSISLEEVEIYRFHEGVFYSHLLLRSVDREVELDSRTSDAVALAVRTGARVFAAEEVMRSASFVKDDAPTDANGEPDLKSLTLEGLKSYLQQCVDNEEYEMAAEIQKLIRKRESE